MKRRVFLILLILWTAFIFFNSLKRASESIEQSSAIANIVSDIVVEIYNDNPPANIGEYIELNLNSDLRNLAHVFEFFVLYILAYLFFLVTGDSTHIDCCLTPFTILC